MTWSSSIHNGWWCNMSYFGLRNVLIHNLITWPDHHLFIIDDDVICLTLTLWMYWYLIWSHDLIIIHLIVLVLWLSSCLAPNTHLQVITKYVILTSYGQSTLYITTTVISRVSGSCCYGYKFVLWVRILFGNCRNML